MNSILKKAKKENINTDYFPYIIIKDALDEKLYDDLINNYPSLDDLLKSHSKMKNKKKVIDNNSRYDMNAEYSLKNSNISNSWKKFISYHTSHEFYLEILNLFENEIKKLHPNLEKKIGKKLRDLKTNIRFDNKNIKDFSLECQISMNSPVTNNSTVRGLHIDEANKLYAGLLYCRNKNDDSIGGNLEIFKFTDDYPNINNLNFKNYQNKLSELQNINSDKIKKIETVKYDKNVLVFFINCKKAIHSVSIRNKTKHNRKFINFVGCFNNLNKIF